MCGVAGIVAYRELAPAVAPDELARIRDHMKNRGPDGQGQWLSGDGRVGLAHRRLKIIDLSDRAAQPMVDADSGCVISFNGEIYNYRELRADLLARGHRFTSESDTEVLLKLYHLKGERMLEELRGMFAFAIWDPATQRLLCARDPYGIKPLYYADDGRTLRLASQVKALLAGGQVSTTVAPAGRAGFYLWGSVPEPWTWFEAVRALPAGHVLSVDRDGVVAVSPYDSLARAWHPDAAAEPMSLPAALRESVAAHLVADVPVGLFLSSGIDSCALLALMKELGVESPQCITLGFSEFQGQADDETMYAGQAAEMHGAAHHVVRYTPADIEALLPHFLAAMDQPSIDGLNTWLVSRAAGDRGLKVAMSGLGGDELLGGYPSFTDIPKWVRRWHRLGFLSGTTARHPALLRALSRLPVAPKAWALPVLGGDWATAYLLRRGIFMPWELSRFMEEDEARAGLDALRPLESINQALRDVAGTAGGQIASDFARVAVMESSFYLRNQLLRDADWAGMAHSLEIRTPLVDRRLLSQVARQKAASASTTAANGKAALATSPVRALPDSLIQRPKTGFTLPMNRWLEAPSLKSLWAHEPGLQHRSCHWSRRWLHTVSQAYEAA